MRYYYANSEDIVDVLQYLWPRYGKTAENDQGMFYSWVYIGNLRSDKTLLMWVQVLAYTEKDPYKIK